MLGGGAHPSTQFENTWMCVVQILAGNARKVSAVRFERISGEEGASETKEVTRVVPKIVKRKWSSDDEEYSFPRRPESDLSDGYLSDQNEGIQTGGGSNNEQS